MPIKIDNHVIVEFGNGTVGITKTTLESIETPKGKDVAGIALDFFTKPFTIGDSINEEACKFLDEDKPAIILAFHSLASVKVFQEVLAAVESTFVSK